jgi:DNA-binding NarL/FixJ family response regulator
MTAGAEARVLVVEGDAIGWIAVRAALESLPEVGIVGSVTTRDDLLAGARATRPDAIVSPCSLADEPLGGLLLQLAVELPGTSMIVLADDPPDWGSLGAARVPSYLLWRDVRGDCLALCLHAAIRAGVVVVSPTVASVWFAGGHPRHPEEAIEITDRELAVLRGLQRGLTQAGIATQLGIHIRTVEATIARLKGKLNAENEFALGVQAARYGLIV